MSVERATDSGVFRSGDDHISPLRATLQGRAYDIATIDSVSLTPPILNRSYGYICIGVGLFIAILGIVVWGVLLTPVIAGLALAVVGVVLAFAVRPNFLVRLNLKNSETVELRYPQRAQAEQIVDALSLAIQRRRA